MLTTQGSVGLHRDALASPPPLLNAKPTLTELPDELILKILAWVPDPWDLGNVRLTCRELRRIVNDNSLFEKLWAKYVGLGSARSATAQTRYLHFLTRGLTQQLTPLHTDTINCLTHSPTHSLVAFGSRNSVIKLWDPDAREERGQLTAHTNAVLALSFLPDDAHLASSSRDQTVRIWALASQECVQVIEMGPAFFNCMAIFSSSAQILGGCPSGSVCLLYLNDQPPRFLEAPHSRAVHAIQLFPCGQKGASGSQDCAIKVWDLLNFTCLFTLTGHSEWVSSLALSPTGQQIVSCTVNGELFLWDLVKQQPISGRRMPRGLYCVAFSPNGHWVAYGGEGGSTHLWSPTGLSQVRLNPSDSTPTHCIVFSPDGTTIYAGRRDGSLAVWRHVLPDQS